MEVGKGLDGRRKGFPELHHPLKRMGAPLWHCLQGSISSGRRLREKAKWIVEEKFVCKYPLLVTSVRGF